MWNTMHISPSELSYRDRAVLRAVADGRCQLQGGRGTSLLIDGQYCSDQFVGTRLVGAGLIACANTTPALTESGIAALQAA